MQKIYTIILCIALGSVGAQAQRQLKNQFNFQTGIIHIKNGSIPTPDYLDFWQLNYFRTVNKHWQVWAQYTKWRSPKQFNGQDLILNRDWDFNVIYTDVPISLYNIYTIDAGVAFTLFQKKAHKLVGLVGVSYGHALTEYITGGIPMTYDNDYVYIYYKYVNKHFIGGTFGVKYDYSLLANWVNIGTSIQYQFLNHYMPLTTYSGVHLGVNF